MSGLGELGEVAVEVGGEGLRGLELEVSGGICLVSGMRHG